MTKAPTFGLGFQLLLIGAILGLGMDQYMTPFLIGYSAFILVFIGIISVINR